ncbi:MAG TPA: class I SAM-dependent RNA methyltransferase [Chloroflexota bacterium]|nr:class I SAM-dependent RNA methyltransferase [Chloroflexota bacterium]
MVNKHDHVELELTDLSYLGGGVGRLPDNRAVFVTGGLPGERVEVEIDEVKRAYAAGHVVAVHRPAPERATPPCPYFGSCGGCQWQHLAYTAHVNWKTRLLERQLSRIAHLTGAPVQPMIPAARPWNYRNQARFSLDEAGNLCFTRPRSRDKLPIAACQILQEPIVELMPRLQGLLPNAHQLVVRYGARTGQFLIAPELPTADVPSGQPFYEEILLGQTYRVSAPSFFQVNTRVDERDLPATIRAPWLPERRASFSQADLLALLVLDRLELTGRETVIDAYGGVGTFALPIAERAARVIGIEEAPAAVHDAEYNARHLENVSFLVGRTEARLADVGVKPDAVVLDPSRVGCAPEVIDALAALRPETLVYVSCAPATLARDLERLVALGFALKDVQPIDMFPQTHHIETVCLLKSAAGS